MKDLLLSMPDLQTLNEAISQAMKCNNQFFQRPQDQCSWNLSKYSYSHSASSTIVSSSHFGAEDIQIDVIWYKPLAIQEKKHCFDGDLYLYCRKSGHKANNCPKEATSPNFQNEEHNYIK